MLSPRQAFPGHAGAVNRISHRSRTVFPEDVDDYPAAIPLRDVHVVDPPVSVHAHAGRVAEDVEDAYVGAPLGDGRLLPTSPPRVLHQRHGALMSEHASSALVRVDDSLREVG